MTRTSHFAALGAFLTFSCLVQAPAAAQGGPGLELTPEMATIMCATVVTDAGHNMRLVNEAAGKTPVESCVDTVLANEDTLGELVEKRIDEACDEIRQAEPDYQEAVAYKPVDLLDEVEDEQEERFLAALEFCKEKRDWSRAEMIRALPDSAIRHRPSTYSIERAGVVARHRGDAFVQVEQAAKEVVEIVMLQREEGIITASEHERLETTIMACVGAARVEMKRAVRGESLPSFEGPKDCVARMRSVAVERSAEYREPSSWKWYLVPILLVLLLAVGAAYRIVSATNDVELED